MFTEKFWMKNLPLLRDNKQVIQNGEASLVLQQVSQLKIVTQSVSRLKRPAMELSRLIGVNRELILRS
jgi:hypothetical protein